MKTCSRCSENKPPSSFYRRAASKDGLQPCCKACDSKSRRARYEANWSHEQERNRNYALSHPEIAKKAKRKWADAHVDEKRKKSRLYARSDHGKLVHKRWKETNCDKVRRYHYERYRAGNNAAKAKVRAVASALRNRQRVRERARINCAKIVNQTKDVPASKRCGSCGLVKPSQEFYRDRGRRDGLMSSCIACSSERAKAWVRKNITSTGPSLGWANLLGD